MAYDEGKDKLARDFEHEGGSTHGFIPTAGAITGSRSDPGPTGPSLVNSATRRWGACPRRSSRSCVNSGRPSSRCPAPRRRESLYSDPCGSVPARQSGRSFEVTYG
jgi:hypothetical protein